MALTPERKAELKKVFEICDDNKDGFISLSHLADLAQQHLGQSHSNISGVFETLSRFNDAIGFEEFCDFFSTFINAPESGSDSQYDFTQTVKRTSNFQDSSYASALHTSTKFVLPNYNSASFHRLREIPSSNYQLTRMPGYERGSPSSLSEFDSVLATNNTSPDSGRKTQSGSSSMSDREENFECYGEGDVECDSDSASARICDEVDTACLQSPPHSLPPSNFGTRNTWVRRSLRGSPSRNSELLVPPQRRWGSFRHAPKRVGGTAVASQLYRTSSFSSGRSSAPDQDDMYSDASIEDDMLDINNKLQMLQQQVGVLSENQTNSDDRYSRVRQDNAALQERVMMLEEQLREAETRGEDRLAEEQRRNKELIARVEREKHLTIENYSIKHSNLGKENVTFSEENQRMKANVEKVQKEKSELEDRLSEAEFASSALRQENSKIGEVSRREKEELRIERERSSQVIEELRCEIERLRAVEESYRKRSPSMDFSSSQQTELEAEVKILREENKRLSEQIEDLQAQLLTSRLEEGRTLVSANNNSLAAEFEQMTNDEESINLRKSLKDAQEANQDLRTYIDGILLNIVENYPQLLEVKRK